MLVSYRAWLTYLEAQLTLLAASAEGQTGLDPFEGVTSTQERAEGARRRIAALPADKRELFDAIYDQDRQRIQRQLDAEAPLRGGTVKRTDPDEVARRALTHLREEARGLHRDDRRGLVPRGKPDAVKWLAIDLAEIEQAPPSETEYQLSAGRTHKRRSLFINLGMAALAIVAIPVLIALLQQPGQTAAASGLPIVNGDVLRPWPITLVSDGGGAWDFQVAPVTTRWPASCVDAATGGGCWLQNSFRPLELCLPADNLRTIVGLRVDAAAGLPSRLFTITPADGLEADLLIMPCDEDANAIAPLVGRLQALELPPVLAPGAPAPGAFQVSAITVQGRGEDSTIAAGSLRLSVTIQDNDETRDWGALAPTVLLADGSTASPSGTASDGAERRLDYLIANQTEPFDVLWQVAAADQVVRYRATLEPPPARDAVLRTRLRIENLVVTPSQQTMAVALALHNTATTPLVVVEADLGFQTSATRREIAASTLRQPLDPDEQRVITVELPLESGMLQLGPFRYALTVGR